MAICTSRDAKKGFRDLGKFRAQEPQTSGVGVVFVGRSKHFSSQLVPKTGHLQKGVGFLQVLPGGLRFFQARKLQLRKLAESLNDRRPVVSQMRRCARLFFLFDFV